MILIVLRTEANCKADNVSKNTANADIVHPPQYTLQQNQQQQVVNVIGSKATLLLHMTDWSQSTQNRSFQRRFPKPISWFGVEKTKPNTTKVRIHQSKEMHYNTK